MENEEFVKLHHLPDPTPSEDGDHYKDFKVSNLSISPLSSINLFHKH